MRGAVSLALRDVIGAVSLAGRDVIGAARWTLTVSRSRSRRKPAHGAESVVTQARRGRRGLPGIA